MSVNARPSGGHHIGFDSDISVTEDRFLPKSGDVVDGLLTLVIQEIGDDYIAALGGDAQGHGPAETAGTTGDEGGTALFGRGKTELAWINRRCHGIPSAGVMVEGRVI